MTKLDLISAEMIVALKEQDKEKKETLAAMTDAIQKAAITKTGRVEITDELIDAALLQEKKTIQEMIDTCPAERQDLLAKYQAKMDVVNRFAPVIMFDINDIKNYIETILGLEITKTNRGAIMKGLKNKADLSVASQLFK